MSVHYVNTLRLARHHNLVATVPAPSLSWSTASTTEGWYQAWAELADGTGAVHRVYGTHSVDVSWPFVPLSAGERRSVTVRTASRDGVVSPWSTSYEVRAGFLGDAGWIAPFIRLQDPIRAAQPVMLRHEVMLDVAPEEAVLFVTALGAHRTRINGVPINDHVLAPGWTSYDQRVPFETVDVTDSLVVGNNVIAVELAGAWRTEEYGFFGDSDRVYGDQPSYSASLHLQFADGTKQVVETDSDWLAYGGGAILDSSIYQGERVDARLLVSGWDLPGADVSGWKPAVPEEVKIDVVPKLAPPVRCTREVSVVEVITTPSGATVLDFGQNLVGRLRIVVNGSSGTEIVLRHAEVLENGEICTRPLGRAAATDAFILAGTKDEAFEAEFTFHGFRYVQVDGWPGNFDPAAVRARVIHSDMQETASFTSSHALINKLHENVVWSMRGNFLSVPTDCPQRAERLGWTGDIQVFATTASTLFDVDGFLADWLRDLTIEQGKHNGVVPFVVPDVLRGKAKPAAAWGDAATVVPWTLWQRYSDSVTLADQFPGMRQWADTIIEKTDESGLWEGSMQFGDWLDPDAPPSEPGAAKCSRDIVATAYVVRSARLVADAAALLGQADAAEHYGQQADRVAAAFRNAYVTPAGRMMSDAPTAYALALAFGIVTDPGLRTALGDRLAERVRASGYKVSTGFVGTPIILGALTATGHAATAGKLLLTTDNPSWLYPVTMGATTIWERWDSMLPDGSVNPGEMTSFNHYALGAVVDWLHSALAGLSPAAPGWSRISVAPTPLAGFDLVRSEQLTPYGPAASGWHHEGDDTVVTVLVPANTTAVVVLPWAEDALEVGSGSHEFRGKCPRPADDTLAYSLGTPLAVLAEDPAAFATVRRVLDEFSPEYSAQFFARTQWTMGSVPADVMFGVPPHVLVQLDEALRAGV